MRMTAAQTAAVATVQQLQQHQQKQQQQQRWAAAAWRVVKSQLTGNNFN